MMLDQGLAEDPSRMDALSVVVAFSDSPALRETLSVLLEHDCQLRFLPPSALAAFDPSSVDLAVVALQRPTRFLAELTARWPGLPTVAVARPETVLSATPTAAPRQQGIQSVPLEPEAIRAAVLQRLVPAADAHLRATAQRIAETLRTELAYSFTALRSCSALHATAAGPDTYALLGAVMREQSYVLGECVAHLQHFRARPRTAVVSSDFAVALCHQLAKPGPAGRGLLCDCTVDASAPHSAGPVALVSMVAAFLHAHVRRRTAVPAVRVQATPSGIVLRYVPRHSSSRRTTQSWPLLLVWLAVQPWSWRVRSTVQQSEGVVTLYPAERARK
ncbi:MAG: hypothetical protein ACE5I7_11575 [Candidatus Binatia bacterium]